MEKSIKKQDYWGKLDLEGVITIASRLKRLSDLFYQQAQEVYDSRSRAFKTSWFSVLATIKREDEIDFKTLADKNNVSNSAISQIMRELEKKELVSIRPGIDKRSRLISLTPEGEKFLASIIPDLIDIETILKDLLGEDGPTLINILDKTENGLRKNSFYELLEISIEEYTDDDKNDFKTLNKDWIIEYFNEIEDFDKDLFEDPKKFTANTGGQLFLAKFKGKTIGTVALIPEDEDNLEIAKLTCDKNYRKRGIAQKLLNRSVLFAKSHGYKKLRAHSNTCLKEAELFYFKNGFKASPYNEERFERVDVIYEKLLTEDN